MSTTFAARYDGRCAADCGQRIHAGDDVQYVDDEVVHVGCVDDQPRKPNRPEPPACPSCWTTHVGECM